MEGEGLLVTLNVCSELVLRYLGHLSPQIDQHGFPQGTTSSPPSAASMVPKPNPTTTWGRCQYDGSCTCVRTASLSVPSCHSPWIS